MIPAFLISFREALEAALIVATLIGMLVKLKAHRLISAVWLGTFWAISLSIILLGIGSFLGLAVHDLFEEIEPLFEGSVMMLSAFFITWAVFFLHKNFAHKKLALLSSARQMLSQQERKGVLFLAFSAVFREGIEIVLFLSTLFFSTQPVILGSGIFFGMILAVGLAFILFCTTVRLPVYQAFRLTSILLILFAAGMLAHGYHELVEAHVLPEIAVLPTLTLTFLPQKTTIAGQFIRSLFGLSRQMHTIELALWGLYTFCMSYLVFFRKSVSLQEDR